MFLVCGNCGREWGYKGAATEYTSCPRCKSSVRVRPALPCVYVMKNEHNEYKIGRTANLAARKKSLEKSTGMNLTTIAVFELPTIEATKVAEKCLRQKFVHNGICGPSSEWVLIPDDDVESIKDINVEELSCEQYSGICFEIPKDLNHTFHNELEHRLGRTLRNGDIKRIGPEIIKLWLSSTNQPLGIYFAVNEDLRQKFYAEIQKRNGRPLRRGDVLNAGEEAIQKWIAQIDPK